MRSLSALLGGKHLSSPCCGANRNEAYCYASPVRPGEKKYVGRPARPMVDVFLRDHLHRETVALGTSFRSESKERSRLGVDTRNLMIWRPYLLDVCMAHNGALCWQLILSESLVGKKYRRLGLIQSALVG